MRKILHTIVRLRWLILLIVAMVMISLAHYSTIKNRVNPTEIHILSTSDTHGYLLLNNEQTIHYDQLAAYKYKLEAEGKHVILLDAGNAIQGSLATNMSQGGSTIELMNAVGYDAINIGYHDFIFGARRWLELQKIADFSILSANIVWIEAAHAFVSYQLFPVEDVTIGVIGITSAKAKETVSSDKVEGIDFLDPSQILSILLEDIHDEADIIVVMASLGGHSPDLAIKLARNFPEIVIIMDSDYANDLYGSSESNTLIVNNLRHAKTINDTRFLIEGKEIVDITNTRLTSDDLDLDASWLADERIINIQEQIKRIHLKLDERFKDRLFINPIFLNGEKLMVRKQHTNLGYLVTDSFKAMSGADIAFINAGALRGSLAQGDIDYEAVFNVMPYGNEIMTIMLTGEQIKEVLEHSLSEYPKDFSGFLHVSGLTYNYDMTNDVGKRVLDVWIKDTPLNLTKIYTVAVTTFLVQGGDGHTVLVQPVVQTFDKDINIFIAYTTSYGDEIFNKIRLPRAVQRLNAQR